MRRVLTIGAVILLPALLLYAVIDIANRERIGWAEGHFQLSPDKKWGGRYCVDLDIRAGRLILQDFRF